MRWLVEVSSVGKTDLQQKVCVEADSWQRALQAARAQRGEEGPMSGFSIELLDEGYRAVDPVTRLRFVVKRTGEDTPLTTGPGKATPPPASKAASVPPAPPSSMPMSAKAPKAPISSSPLGADAGSPKSIPPRPGVSSVAPKKPSLAPPAPGASVGATTPGLPAVKLLTSREQNPTEASPLSYREYAFAVPAGTSEDVAAEVLRAQLKLVEAQLAGAKMGKLVNLAVFDAEFTGKPPAPPLATLAWKDWKGEPVVAFPRRGGASAAVKPPGSSVTPPPPSAAIPRPASSAPAAPAVAPSVVVPPAPAVPSVAPVQVVHPVASAGSFAPPTGGSVRPPAAPFAASPSAPPPPPSAAVVAPAKASVPPPAPSAPARPSVAPAAPGKVSVPPPAPSAPVPSVAPVATFTPAAPGVTAPSVPPPAPSVPPPAPPVVVAPSVAPPSAAPAPVVAAPSVPPPSAAPPVVAAPSVPAPAPASPAASVPPASGADEPEGLVRTPSGRFVRGRTVGDELISSLFESMHDLHFLRDALDGGQFCLALATEVLPARLALVHFFDIEKREWVVACTRGKDAAKLLTQRIPETDALLRDAARRRRAVVVADAAASKAARHDAFGGARSLIVAPIMQAGRVLGALEIVNPLDGKPFTEDEGNAITYIAEQYAEYLGSRGIVVDAKRILAAAR